MKQLILLGGALGFLIGAGFGLAQSSPWPDALWRASITACAGSLLLRWWGRMWVNCLQEAQQAKLAADAPAEPTPTPVSTKGK